MPRRYRLGKLPSHPECVGWTLADKGSDAAVTPASTDCRSFGDDCRPATRGTGQDMQTRLDPPPPMPDTDSPFAAGIEAALMRAEQRGHQVLLYVPRGPLGGNFACSRCSARALQPDLLEHSAGCSYGLPGGR